MPLSKKIRCSQGDSVHSMAERRKRLLLSLFIAAACWAGQTGDSTVFVLARGESGARPTSVSHSRVQLAGISSGVSVENMEKHPRLPVWPAWFGIVYILLDLLLGKPSVGAWLEDRFGGRVCPMIFRDTAASDPFLLVAHHRHSFNAFDPFRYLFRFLLPEGFPAHPHRGFETVTYVLRGGLVHRDSLGVKKSYGAPKDSSGSGADAAVQWMTAGSGMLHEEMWRTGEALESSDQELFQIWVNLPKADKYTNPRMQMLGSSDTAESFSASKLGGMLTEVHERGPVPTVEPAPGVSVRIVAGEADGVRSPIETFSDMAILHVTLQPGAASQLAFGRLNWVKRVIGCFCRCGPGPSRPHGAACCTCARARPFWATRRFPSITRRPSPVQSLSNIGAEMHDDAHSGQCEGMQVWAGGPRTSQEGGFNGAGVSRIRESTRHSGQGSEGTNSTIPEPETRTEQLNWTC